MSTTLTVYVNDLSMSSAMLNCIYAIVMLFAVTLTVLLNFSVIDAFTWWCIVLFLWTLRLSKAKRLAILL